MIWTLAIVAVALAIAVAAFTFIRSQDDRARVIIAVLIFLAVTGVGRAVMKPKIVEAARMEIPLYRAIKQYEPALYDELKSDETDRDGTNQLALFFRTKKHTAELIAKYAPSASDESLYKLFRNSTEIMESLVRMKAGGNWGLFVPGGEVNPSNVPLTEDVVQNELSALADIINSGAASPRRNYDVARADRVLARAADQIYQGNGDMSVLERPDAAANDQIRGMGFVAAYYRRILDLPQPDRDLAIRRVLTQAH